jgi:hypothetical protein
MPRKPRIELEGGLYHIIARGNNRGVIFHTDQDHKKFLAQLAQVKQRLPFYLYATNGRRSATNGHPNEFFCKNRGTRTKNA